MNIKLKEIIFNKLYEDLKHVEIIPYYNDIWFIDRENKYWYLRYQKSGDLWWRWEFFNSFFKLFSAERDEYEWVIAEWVEEVLNCKVETPKYQVGIVFCGVEEVLNCKVEIPNGSIANNHFMVEEVLNCKVETPERGFTDSAFLVEEVLNCKVETPRPGGVYHYLYVAEQMLNCKAETPRAHKGLKRLMVEDVLNYKSIRNEQ